LKHIREDNVLWGTGFDLKSRSSRCEAFKALIEAHGALWRRAKKSVVNEAGDFIFVPPDLPHQPVNLRRPSPRSPLWRATIPRQEHVILLPEEGATKN
jgi:hypothetical protein